jgi:hypothetical protein
MRVEVHSPHRMRPGDGIITIPHPSGPMFPTPEPDDLARSREGVLSCSDSEAAHPYDECWSCSR